MCPRVTAVPCRYHQPLRLLGKPARPLWQTLKEEEEAKKKKGEDDEEEVNEDDSVSASDEVPRLRLLGKRLRPCGKRIRSLSTLHTKVTT